MLSIGTWLLNDRVANVCRPICEVRCRLSSLVITGQMSRNDALKILEQPPLSEDESKELFTEVASKLGISEKELKEFHEMPECTEKFRSQEKIYTFGIRLYEKVGLEMRIRK